MNTRVPYVNLIPWREHDAKMKLKRWVYAALITVLSTIFLSIGVHYLLQRQIRLIKHQKQHMHQVQEQFKSQSEYFQALTVDLSRAQISKHILGIVQEILKKAPAGLKIDSVTYESGIIGLEGTSQHPILDKWLSQIRQMPMLKNIELVDAQLQGAQLKWILHLTLKQENTYFALP